MEKFHPRISLVAKQVFCDGRNSQIPKKNIYTPRINLKHPKNPKNLNEFRPFCGADSLTPNYRKWVDFRWACHKLPGREIAPWFSLAATLPRKKKNTKAQRQWWKKTSDMNRWYVLRTGVPYIPILRIWFQQPSILVRKQKSASVFYLWRIFVQTKMGDFTWPEQQTWRKRTLQNQEVVLLVYLWK